MLKRSFASVLVASAILQDSLVAGVEEEGKADFYDLKCSACCSMVVELERNLETEKPRMNVDLSKTLAGDNKGKKIDWTVSELRTLELLESLCPGMKEYGIAHQEDGTATFQRYNVGGGSVRIGGSLTIGGDKFRTDQTQLTSYCYELVENYEDPLAEVIRAAGLARKAREEEANRKAKAKRKGEEEDDWDPYEALEMADEKLAMASLDEETRMSKVKKQYRALSRKYHPDKNGGDPEAVKKFVRLAGAYEKISGEEVTPYGDLYREICLDTVGVCLSEEEVDKQKYFFPRYLNSEKFGKASGGGLDEAEAEKKRRRLEEGIDKPKKKKKSKKKKKAKKAEGGEL